MSTTTLDRSVPTGSTAEKATGGDYFRQFAVIFITLLTISVNGLANALPLNGIPTGEISDKYFTLFTPAGYVFAIWGVIYLGMMAYMVYQALPSQRTNPRLRAIGWWYVLGNIANTVWIFCWHWEQLLPSVVLITVLLVCLVMAYSAPGTGTPDFRPGFARRMVDHASDLQHLHGMGYGSHGGQCVCLPGVHRLGWRLLVAGGMDGSPAADRHGHRRAVPLTLA